MSGQSDYQEIIVELVNAAKTESDQKKLEVILHQIREIALHRDTSVLPHVLKDVLDLAMGAKTSIVVFLAEFGGEALRVDFALLPSVLSCYSFLMTVESDKVHRSVGQEITKIYSKAAVYIAEMIAFPGANETAVKQTWKQLCSVTDKLIDKISSNRATEQLRTNGVALVENVVLFGLPAPQMKADPRRRRAAGTEGGGLSVASLTSLHPFVIDVKADLEKAAEDIFSKLVLWAYQGGPQGSPFTPEQMSILGQAMSSIAGQRHARADGSDRDEPRASRAAKALQVMLKGKKSVCKLMAGESRKALVLAIHRFVGTSPPDPADDIPRLREGLIELEALGFVDAATATDSKGKKRGREEQVAGDDMEPSPEEAEATRASALAALEASETNMKRLKMEHAAQTTVAGFAPTRGADVAETELSPELAQGPDDSTTSIAKITSRPAAERGTGIEYNLTPLQISQEEACNLAGAALQRLLESFYLLKAEGPKAVAAHCRMAVRTALSQAALEALAGAASATVPMFSVVPSDVNKALLVGVPMEVTLPKPLWQLLSFVLSPSTENAKAQVRQRQDTLLAAVREKVPILVMLMKELMDQAERGQQSAADAYDGIVLLTLGRMLQSVNLREVAKPFFAVMPRVPLSCISTLNLLLHTGTKPAAGIGVSSRGRGANRGTRQEAIALLGSLVFAVDEEAGQESLNRLLWCTVSDDFEVRSKAIALIANDLIQAQDWVYESVSKFALQAMAQLIGVEAVQARAEVVEESREQVWGALVVKEATADSAAAATGAGMDVENAIDDSNAAASSAEDAEAGADAEGAAPVAQGLSLADALQDYDDGASYGGSFSAVLSYPSTAMNDAEGISSIDFYARRCIQLLSQMCALDPALLGAFMDAAAAMAVTAGLSTPEAAQEAAREAVAAHAARTAAAIKSDTPGTSADSAASEPEKAPPALMTPLGRFERAYCIMRGELSNILPAVVVHHPTEKIFEALARSDPLGRPLLVYATEVLHGDTYMPATPECIAAATGYLRATAPEETAEAMPAQEEDQFLAGLSEGDLRFCFPLLGGFKRAAVEAALPRILNMLIGTPDTLNRIITRIVRCRPPVCTKAELLTWLHRLEPDKFGLDRVQIRDLLGVLLDREDYDGETIRETLFNLVEDAIPCLYLMRTGILSAKKYKDVRKYLLSETVPKLIRKRVWTIKDENSGKYPVWEGVVQCVRLMADQKDAEQMLRCVLSLDGPRLAMVMKVAPKVSPILAKLLKTLSVREREDVITGHWAGIAHEKNKIDSEKKKIIEELQSMKL